MIHLFHGHDERVEAGTTAFVRSVLAHASEPVAMTALTRKACRGHQEGTNAFTFRRFLVPWLMQYRGWAVFMDGADMLVRGDVRELFERTNPLTAVQVVKHYYTSKYPRKYIGTAMEAENEHYVRKNWCSLMLFNAEHPAWKQITPDALHRNVFSPLGLLQLRFLDDKDIGELPAEWNWLADEQGPNPAAKLLHWTAGLPIFEAHADAPHAQEWTDSLLAASTCTARLQ